MLGLKRLAPYVTMGRRSSPYGMPWHRKGLKLALGKDRPLTKQKTPWTSASRCLNWWVECRRGSASNLTILQRTRGGRGVHPARWRWLSRGTSSWEFASVRVGSWGQRRERQGLSPRWRW